MFPKNTSFVIAAIVALAVDGAPVGKQKNNLVNANALERRGLCRITSLTLASTTSDSSKFSGKSPTPDSVGASINSVKGTPPPSKVSTPSKEHQRHRDTSRHSAVASKRAPVSIKEVRDGWDKVQKERPAGLEHLYEHFRKLDPDLKFSDVQDYARRYGYNNSGLTAPPPAPAP
jgi:hypothetical protein